MRKAKLITVMCCISITMFFWLIPPSWGRGPWHWVMTLRQPKIKDAMINPTALYIDPHKGNYYVVDSGKDRLLSFDHKGKLLHIFTAGDELDLPMDMTRGPQGNVWVVEKGKNSLSLIDLKAKKVIRHHLKVDGRKIYPHRVELSGGLFYILDKESGDVFAFTPEMELEKRYSCGDCSQGFIDFKVYKDIFLAMSMDQGGTIYEFSLDGKLKKRLSLDGRALFPVSVCRGPSGYFYVLDRHNSRVLVFDKQGVFKYGFLEFGSSQGQLYYPIEIRFDPWGRLCVVEEGNARVEVFAR